MSLVLNRYLKYYGDLYPNEFKSNNDLKMTLTPTGLGIGITEPTGLFHIDAGTSSTGNGSDITIKAENSLSGNYNGGNINLITGEKGSTKVHLAFFKRSKTKTLDLPSKLPISR